MVTDDERRRVAKELRDFSSCDLDDEWGAAGCYISGAVMGEDFCPGHCGECFERVCDTLADLIESSDAAKCVVEVKVDGEKLEKLVHDAVVEYVGVDREALLALADKARELGDEEKSGVDSFAVRCTFRVFARCIREALGEGK